MPNRILKESICTSEEIDRLSLFHEVFFYRLIVNCDDYGRMDARPRVVASRLFPLKDVQPEDIVTALTALRDDGLIVLYEHEGKPYLQLKTWVNHQSVRNQKSKYPSPDDDDCMQLNSIEINCNQMNSIESKCSRNPIQSNPYPNPYPNPNPDPNPNPYPKETPLTGCKEKTAKRFSPPTPDQVQSFCEENGLSVDAERFCDHYASKGWKIGSSPMKDWKAAVRNWARRDATPVPVQQKKVVAQQYEQRDYKDIQEEHMASQQEHILRRLREMWEI